MWRKILTILVGVVLVVVVFQIFFRYKVLQHDRHFYRYDRLTGQLSYVGHEVEAEDSSVRAVELVKYLPSNKGLMSQDIQKQFSKIHGDITFMGWKAVRVENNLYLVSCTFLQNNKEKGWWWEVSLDMNIARPIVVPDFTVDQFLDFPEATIDSSLLNRTVDKELAAKYKLK